ncbi:hypothetical protein F8M41_012301 [Gigaspora margarita]|uniref:Uncharacterized protein n=1 Tax=Gigaspora margarita TaxID=4874 RepID=A0A8H4AT39_GIGMA|nr:hypothetical protein F8M41_012301 [Gigaspora margarita]
MYDYMWCSDKLRNLLKKTLDEQAKKISVLQQTRKQYYDDNAFFYDVPRPENLPDWVYVSEEDEVVYNCTETDKSTETDKGKATEKGKAIEKRKATEKRKVPEDAPVEKPAKRGQFYSSDYDKQVLYSRKKEYKTSKSTSMGKICGALKYTAKYTSKENSNNKSVVSVEEAPK